MNNEFEILGVCDSSYKKIIDIYKVAGRLGARTLDKELICHFKYESISDEYYETTKCLVVKQKYGLKGVVRECKEIIIMLYHDISFNYKTNLWVCKFRGLPIDYYTINGIKTVF